MLLTKSTLTFKLCMPELFIAFLIHFHKLFLSENQNQSKGGWSVCLTSNFISTLPYKQPKAHRKIRILKHTGGPLWVITSVLLCRVVTSLAAICVVLLIKSFVPVGCYRCKTSRVAANLGADCQKAVYLLTSCPLLVL